MIHFLTAMLEQIQTKLVCDDDFAKRLRVVNPVQQPVNKTDLVADIAQPESTPHLTTIGHGHQQMT